MIGLDGGSQRPTPIMLVVLLSFACFSRTVVDPPRAPTYQEPLLDELSGTAVAVSPTGLMRPGAEARLQRALIGRGVLASGHVTGRLDDPTRDALRRFQRTVGLPATGLPGYATVAALALEPTEIFESAPRPPDEAESTD